MDLALEFIRKEAQAKQSFFAQVCFGSPHAPHQAADEFQARFTKTCRKTAGFLGEFRASTRPWEICGATLRELNIADNTLVWFISDNGGITPLSMDSSGKGKQSVGNRTASVLEWPAGVPQPIQTNVACAHMDIYSTLLDIAGVAMPHQRPLDGISLVPLFEGKMENVPAAGLYVVEP